ncbi:MAG: shikimate dehydrogenase [Burkholderiales bacterium]|nr:shikimate dehydrogenase [Burkholderiales bacterium]
MTAPAKLLVGLIGAGIQRSLTPAMHETEARAQGLALHYQLIDLDATGQGVEALPTLISAARTMGFAGLNVTYPCKQAVIPLLDGLSDEAEAMGAVNTIVFERGAAGRAVRAVGHNTDGSGWRWGFERTLPGADLSRVVLLGAGGAGSAIAHALLRMDTRALVLVDADPARAAAAAERLNAIYPGRRASHAADAAAALAAHSAQAAQAAQAAQGGTGRATGLVHATPTGMDKLPGLPLPAALLRPDLWVSEIVYFPLQTELLKAAGAAGCAVCDGGTMAVGQAVGAFRLFTGCEPDPARMDAHFRSMVARRTH